MSTEAFMFLTMCSCPRTWMGVEMDETDREVEYFKR